MPRLVAIVALAALIPAGLVRAATGPARGAMAVLAAVAVWDSVMPHPAGSGSPVEADAGG